MARSTKSGRKRKPVISSPGTASQAVEPGQSEDGRALRAWFGERREWLLIGGILIATFLAFTNALNGEFLYDDQVQILKNPTIKSLANIPKVFVQSVWQFLDEASDRPLGPYYRPLFNAALIVNYYLFGFEVFGWHVMSLFLHITATLLIYLLARRWKLRPSVAAGSALFFGLHPIHSEAVAWISALPDLLAGVFALSSLLLFEIYYHRQSGRRQLAILSLSLGFALLAMLSKEVAVVIPVFIVVREWLDRQADEKKTVTRSWLLRATPFVMIALFYFAVRYSVLGFFSKNAPNAANITTWQVLLTIPSIVLRYIRTFFFPASLAIVYDDRYVANATDVRFWGFAVVVAVTLGVTVWILRGSPPGRRALAWSLLSLLPVLNLRAFNQEESLAHDRYLYLPSIGLCLLMALALDRVSIRFGKLQSRASLAGTLLVAVSFFGLTVYQNRSWRNFIALAKHASALAPEKSFLYYNLGCAYEAQARDLEAEQEYNKAVQHDALHNEAHINLAVLLTRQARYEEALEHLQISRSVAPDHPVMLYALGNVYMRTNRHRQAIETLDRLSRLKPQHRMVYTNLGLCYETVGDKEQAIANFRKAIEVAPTEDWTNVARNHLSKLQN